MSKKPEHSRANTITKEQMLDAIIQSGYVLEHRVEQLFAEKGYHISNSNYFVDPDTDKMREVDLIAENANIQLKAEGRANIGTFTYRFICECENNHQPSVFFLSDGKSPNHGEGVNHISIPNPVLPEGASYTEHLTWGDSLLNSPNVFPRHHFFNMRLATQYCTFFPREKNKPDAGWIAKHSDDQHDTLQNVLKATIFASEKDDEGINRMPVRYYGKYQIFLYYPVVIVQNQLFTAQVTKDGIDLQDCDHVVYWRNHKIEDSEHLFGIDVIRESYLPKYIELVEKEVEEMHVEILKNPYLRDSIEKWTVRMSEAKEIESQDFTE